MGCTEETQVRYCAVVRVKCGCVGSSVPEREGKQYPCRHSRPQPESPEKQEQPGQPERRKCRRSRRRRGRQERQMR